MSDTPGPYSAPTVRPAVPRIQRPDPRKPLWQMTHAEKIGRAVEQGMVPRHYAEEALSTKDAAVVFNGAEMRGLGTALMLGDSRWRPGKGSAPGSSMYAQPRPERAATVARPPATVAGVPTNLA